MSDYINQICAIASESILLQDLSEVRKDIEYQYNQNNESHNEFEEKMRENEEKLSTLRNTLETNIEFSKQEINRVEDINKTSFEFVDKNLSTIRYAI